MIFNLGYFSYSLLYLFFFLIIITIFLKFLCFFFIFFIFYVMYDCRPQKDYIYILAKEKCILKDKSAPKVICCPLILF